MSSVAVNTVFSKEVEALVKGVKSNTTDLTCRIKFLNNTDPADGAVITHILCGFTYMDGTTSTSKDEEASIAAHEAGYLFSQNKCVKKVYCHMVWTEPGAGGQDGGNLEDSPANRCRISGQVELTYKVFSSTKDCKTLESTSRFQVKGIEIGNG